MPRGCMYCTCMSKVECSVCKRTRLMVDPGASRAASTRSVVSVVRKSRLPVKSTCSRCFHKPHKVLFEADKGDPKCSQ